MRPPTVLVHVRRVFFTCVRVFIPLVVMVLCATPSARGQAAATPPEPTLPPVVARYESMLAASPGKGTAFDKVYQHFFEGEGLEKLAARWQQRVASGGPGADNFELLAGLLDERRARPDAARGAYGRYTAAHPRDPRGWTALGELETAEGHFKASAEALAHALDPESQPPVQAAGRPALFRALARAQTRDFRNDAALGTWRRLATEFPRDATVLEEVGDALREAGAFDEARTTFESLRELTRSNNDAFGRLTASLRLGQVEEARGRAAAAVGVYQEVVSTAKAGSWLEREARARIEGLYRGQEDLPGLAEYYAKWLADHPRDLEVASRRAAVLVELNRRKEAIDLLQQAVGWAPDREDLPVELARRLGEANRPAEAVTVLEKLTAAAPEEKSYWVMLGDARWQLLDNLATPEEKTRGRQAALDAWRHLAPADTKDAGAVGRLADLFAGHRLNAEAEAEYAHAAALAPDVPDPRERWAAFVAQIGQKERARTILVGIVAEPRNATAANYLRLAGALRRMDDGPGALAAAQNALEREPGSFDALALVSQLLGEAKRWDESLALYNRLLAAAPGPYVVEQVQGRQVSALAAAGKLDAARGELAGRLHGDPPLGEPELALLVRMDLQSATNPAFGAAGAALEQGHARFPLSATLVRLEAERAKRLRDADGQIAALRLLAELQPAQGSDVRREITRVLQDAGRQSDALAAAGELVAASPANAAGHLLLADLLFESGRSEDGVASLQRAVKLSDKPNDVRLRLARAFTELGQDERARATVEEAFEAATDAHERLTLMKPLSEVYFRRGKLDELIERFQRRQQGEADGWRYALYLAEIYQGALDFGAARRELAKALAARPKDAGLLRQIVRLAGEEGNAAEVARYQALLAEAEPSDNNRVAFVQALLENNQAAEAFNQLRAGLAIFTKSPGALESLLPLLTRNGLTGKVGDLLAGELGQDPDPKSRMAVAMFQVAGGELDRAREALWSIFSLPKTSAAVAPLASSPTGPASGGGRNTRVNPLYSLLGGGGSSLDLRYQAAQRTRETAQNFIDRDNGNVRVTRSLGSLGAGGGSVPGVDPADSARDMALVYLAAIAVKQGKAEEFLVELNGRLEARHPSPGERLLAYAVVDQREGLLREFTALAPGPEPEPGLDRFCLGLLVTIATENDVRYQRFNQKTPLGEAEVARLVGLFEQFAARVVSADPDTKPAEWDSVRHVVFQALGRKEEAARLRDKMVANTDHQQIDQLAMGLGLLLNDPEFSPADLAAVKRLCQELAALKGKGGNSVMAQQLRYYPSMIFQSESGASKLPAPAFADLLADLLSLGYPAGPPVTRLNNGQSGGFRMSGNSFGDTDFLPPTRFLEADSLQMLRMVSQQMKQGDSGAERLKELRSRLDRQAQELPAGQCIYPQISRVYLDWWSGEPEPALAAARALLAENQNDPDLRLLTGVMLGKNNQPAEALALLKDVDARFGEAGIVLQQQVLLLAKQTKDTETARRAALRLAGLRLSAEDRRALAEDLRELGLKEKADQLAKAPAVASAGSSRASSNPNQSYEQYQRLQKFEADKNDPAAISLAQSILTTLQPPTGKNARVNGEFVVNQAVSTLRRLKKLEEFTADTERQLAQDPDSVRLNYLLAQLAEQERGGRGGAVDYTAEVLRNGKRDFPVWVKLVRANEEITGAFSRDGERWEELGRAKVDLGAAPLAVLAGTSRHATRVNTSTLDHVALSPLSPAAETATPASVPAVPAPWRELDLVSELASVKPYVVPPSEFRDGVWTLHGGGWDLFGFRDSGHLVHRPLDGAVEFVARVATVEDTDEHAKAGIMFRADLGPNAPCAAVFVKPDGTVAFQHRDRRDPVTGYWRKLAELRPKESVFKRALAQRLSQHGDNEEALAVYAGLMTEDPDATFADAQGLVNIYQNAGQLDALVERLLTWKPAAPNPNNPYRNQFQNVFVTAARQCVEKKLPEKAIALCRRGLELDSDRYDTSLHDLLVTTLAAAGRRDEARGALLAYFVPTPGEANATAQAAPSGPQLGFRSNSYYSQSSQPPWMRSTSSTSEGEIWLSGLEMLTVAQRLELLPDLQTGVEARLSTLGEGSAAKTEPGLKPLLTMLRVENRDPRAPEEVTAMLGEKARANRPQGLDHVELALRLTLARQLKRWPGQEALALEALRDVRRMMETNAANLGGSYRTVPLVRQATAELQSGDGAAAAGTLRDLGKLLFNPGASSRSGGSSGGSFEINTAEQALRLMLRNPESDADYLDLLGRVRGTPEGKKLYFGYDLEKNQRDGQAPRYQAYAWLLDENPGAGDTLPGAVAPEATLVYEIRPEHPYDRRGTAQFPTSRGRSIPGSERERTLVFSHGKDYHEFTPLGRVTTTACFGTWTGPVPTGAGFLQVAIEGEPDAPPPADGKEPADPGKPGTTLPPGWWLRVVRARNLIQNPDFAGLAERAGKPGKFSLPGWPALPEGFWRQSADGRGGPLPGRAFMQCELGAPWTPQRGEQEIVGARIPLEPGRSYLQSAWVRDPGIGTGISFGRRYLDASGTVLKTTVCPNYASLTWRRYSQRLSPEGDNGSDAIPPGAVALEPVLKVNAAAEWGGLFLGVID